MRSRKVAWTYTPIPAASPIFQAHFMLNSQAAQQAPGAFGSLDFSLVLSELQQNRPARRPASLHTSACAAVRGASSPPEEESPSFIIFFNRVFNHQGFSRSYLFIMLCAWRREPP